MTALLTSKVAKLVDRALAPASQEHVFPGVEQHLLIGSPVDGGFGCLPWKEHILARHAWWGAKFVSAPIDTEIPWIAIGRALLRSHCPWWGPLAVFDAATTNQSPIIYPANTGGSLQRAPQPLRRMIAGLQALGHVCDVVSLRRSLPTSQQQQEQQPPPATTPGQQQHPESMPPSVVHQPVQSPIASLVVSTDFMPDLDTLHQELSHLVVAPVLTPGAWCALAPLFGNHFLPCSSIPGIVPGGLQSLPVPEPRSEFRCHGGYTQGHMRCLADLFRCWYVIQQATSRGLPHPLALGYPDDPHCELAYLCSLIADVPAAWSQAVLSAIQHPPDWPPVHVPNISSAPTAAEQAVEHMLLSRLGWRNLPDGSSVSVVDLSVKAATSLQLGHVRAERMLRHIKFVELALGTREPAAVSAGYKRLQSCMCCVWRQLKWDNFFKEVYWRLILNGLPTAQRMHHTTSQCLCDSICPGQQHHFWDCPIAQAVVQVVARELSSTWCSRTPGVCPVQQQHIWLMHPPPGPRHLHAKAWMVVCLSAINAMDCGRKTANDLCRQLHMQPTAVVIPVAPAVATPQQRSITSFFHPALGPAAQQQQQQPAQQQLNRQQHMAQTGQPHVGLRQQPAAVVPVAPPAGQRRITALLHPAALSEAEQQQLLQRQQNREQQRILLEQQQALQRQQARQQLLVQAKQQALAKFWQLLADFVVLNPCPGRAFGTLPHDHPFLCIDANDRLCMSPRQNS
eukprot:GHUV01000046.1.p1 GENE.GHUV01000046.1~~GHUV01000046.1.p1  ORF type:complete len:778 (+),score=164.24 GHUV01000046.1:127-2334(+)